MLIQDKTPEKQIKIKENIITLSSGFKGTKIAEEVKVASQTETKAPKGRKHPLWGFEKNINNLSNLVNQRQDQMKSRKHDIFEEFKAFQSTILTTPDKSSLRPQSSTSYYQDVKHKLAARHP